MRGASFVFVVTVGLVTPAPVRGQTRLAAAPASGGAEDAKAYCRFVTGVADSASDLEMAPTLFGAGGVVSGADVSPGGSVLGPTTRVIAGASYSLSGLVRGVAMRQSAGAECRRYRTVSELHAFAESTQDGFTRGSLAAKLAVLDDALPKAEQMLAAARAAMAQSRATVEQVGALELRVDALRAMAADARAALGGLSRMPEPPRSIQQVLSERQQAEADAERYEARVRRSHAWDLSVRGGYDRIFGTPNNYTPVFAFLTLTLDVGGLLQPAAEDRATTGRVAWARSQVEGVDDRVEQALERLRALRDVERKRLVETRVLRADLEARHARLQSIPGEEVAEVTEYLWFDLVRARADEAYLAAHVADLDRILGTDGGAP